MSFFYLKALHIIFVVTWFCGLFYIVRLFVYHAEALARPEPQKTILSDQYKIMEKRLWFGITWPSAILTILFGSGLIHSFLPLKNNTWLITKLALVFGLFLYHLYCGYIRKNIEKFNSFKLRVLNEVSTLFLVSIVFLVVLKNNLSMLWGLIGLIAFAMILMVAIRIYKHLRSA